MDFEADRATCEIGDEYMFAPAPRERMSLYTRAGAIVPTGSVVRYGGDAADLAFR